MGTDIPDAIKQLYQDKQGVYFTNTANSTQLHIALVEPAHPIIRSHGRHVYGAYDQESICINIDDYNRQVGDLRLTTRFEMGKRVGESLWKDIFHRHREVTNTYHEAMGKSHPLTLIFETPRGKLTNLPLEFMRLPGTSKYLVLEHPFVRFVNEIIPRRAVISPNFMALKNKLKILLIASNTEPPIDGVDSEIKHLEDLFKEPKHKKFIELTVIPTIHASIDRIEKELKGDYDIVHYAGHGIHNSQSPEESCLFFWEKRNKQGRVIPMQATKLTYLLQQSDSIRLVYLSCCNGTSTEGEIKLQDDDFLGLADSVLMAGVPAVLGYRWPVNDKRAKDLALAFYKSLLEQGDPEIALWKSRSQLAADDRNDLTWLSPIFISQR
jgi:hypothetical protein